MPHEKLGLQAVIFKRGDWWIGQCLQYDIGAEARTPKEINNELHRAIVAHIAVALENGLEPFKGIPEAPRRYWNMWDDGAPMATTEPIVVTVHGRSRKTPAAEVRLSDLSVAPA